MSLFSNRTNWSREVNQITQALDAARVVDEPFFDLTQSNPTKVFPDFYSSELLQPLLDLQGVSYQPTAQGLASSREAIRRYYASRGYDVPIDRIFLTASTSEAYSYVFRLLCNVEDTILMPQPSYPLFQYLAQLNDVAVDFFQLSDEDWSMPCDDIAEQVSSSCRALVLVSPNNPTGSCIKKEELNRLNEICQVNQMALICDEVFLDYHWSDDQSCLSLVDNKNTLTFVMNGLSKAAGLPQMKCGWIVVNGPDDLVEEAKARLEIIADTYLSVSTPAQAALPTWLDESDHFQNQLNDVLRQNRQALVDALSECSAFQVKPSEAGWYSIIYSPSLENEEAWVMKLIKESRVAVHPGYFYDFARAGHLVVSLLAHPDMFRQAVHRLKVAFLASV